jgi:tetratricopeptide (TPR) repeat protein
MEISERFIRMYPTDKRGYANYTLYLMQFGKPMEAKINDIFERWLALDTTNIDARTQFANFHLDAGQRSYREGSVPDAIDHYQKAIVLLPDFAEAYNSLGIAYRKNHQDDSALVCYLKTIELDRKNAYAYINLANLYDDHGLADSAIALYRHAIESQPGMPDAYYNLGQTYFKIGEIAKGKESLSHAARLGMPEAREFLRSRGLTWE